MPKRLVFITIAVAALGFPAVARQVASRGENRPDVETFTRRAISVGLPNRVSGPIAGLIDVAAEAPAHLLAVTSEQASDGTDHAFYALVELSTTSPRRPIRPISIVLSTTRASEGRFEAYWYRASLVGMLERAALIEGKVDDSGKAIKGSGTGTAQDIESSATLGRFQHELDLWLKKSHLKKEWRSAEFVGGVLKKKGKRR